MPPRFSGTSKYITASAPVVQLLQSTRLPTLSDVLICQLREGFVIARLQPWAPSDTECTSLSLRSWRLCLLPQYTCPCRAFMLRNQPGTACGRMQQWATSAWPVGHVVCWLAATVAVCGAMACAAAAVFDAEGCPRMVLSPRSLPGHADRRQGACGGAVERLWAFLVLGFIQHPG